MYIYDNISLNCSSNETVFHTEIVDKVKARILCSTYFFPENPTLYWIMWKNTVKPERPQMTM